MRNTARLFVVVVLADHPAATTGAAVAVAAAAAAAARGGGGGGGGIPSCSCWGEASLDSMALCARQATAAVDASGQQLVC